MTKKTTCLQTRRVMSSKCPKDLGAWITRHEQYVNLLPFSYVVVFLSFSTVSFHCIGTGLNSSPL